jgi:hypothetical protein
MCLPTAQAVQDTWLEQDSDCWRIVDAVVHCRWIANAKRDGGTDRNPALYSAQAGVPGLVT